MDRTFACSLMCILQTRVHSLPEIRGDDESLRFLALADWGGQPNHPYTTHIQIAVAEQMAATADREHAHFVLSLGDNIYLEGIKKPRDSRLQKTYEDVYYHDSLHIPWYVIAGNHDYYHRVKAQVVYSMYSKRWTFPNLYYKITKSVPGGKTLDILMLDTVILCGQVYLLNGQPVVGYVTDKNSAEREWKWLEDNLKDSKADYLLVGGHYPVYSIGMNGPTECLVQRLEPLLYENHVTAYLAGHDHNLQHIQTNKGDQNMNYFITGSGAYVNDEQTHINSVPENSLKFFFGNFHKLGGFSFIDVSAVAMTFKFIDSNGRVLYEHQMRPRVIR